MPPKEIHIISGGTISPLRPHLALAAPAYGQTGRLLEQRCREIIPEMTCFNHRTAMADGSKSLQTNADVEKLVDSLIERPETKVIFFPVAMCDFDGEVGVEKPEWGICEAKPGRLSTHNDEEYVIRLRTAKKVIFKIREKRKDIFLVGFKHTTGATEEEQYIAGLNLLKSSHCNLVLANDTLHRRNMVITPEEAKYHVTTNRATALRGLVEMVKTRSQLTFTQSTVIDGKSIPWNSPEIPDSLRVVVNYCIQNNAYKPFRGATAGHFAFKVNDTTFLTSIRKSDFNKLAKNGGLVKIVTDGPDTVFAYGAKPSVGGQSQRIVFKDHPGMDCIAHFHCPIRPGSEVPVVSQRDYECGSHQCGIRTSQNLKQFGNLSAVYLDNHGPNIVFNHKINPQEVIDFIVENFDLSQKTGGLVDITRV